jgi:hypothetical protein
MIQFFTVQRSSASGSCVSPTLGAKVLRWDRLQGQASAILVIKHLLYYNRMEIVSESLRSD